MLKILEKISRRCGRRRSNQGEKRASGRSSALDRAHTRASSSDKPQGVGGYGRALSLALACIVAVALLGSIVALSMGSAAADSQPEQASGMVGVPGDQVGPVEHSNGGGPPGDVGPPQNANIPTHASAWEIQASAHAGDLSAEIGETSDGNVALVLTDEKNHDGREVSLDRQTLRETVGNEPERVFGLHESGDRWVSDVEYVGDSAIIDVPKFSTNTITFNGEYNLTAQSATSGSTFNFNVSDDESVDDVSLGITGDTTKNDRSVSGSIIGGGSDSFDVGGTTAPSGLTTASPQISVTAGVDKISKDGGSSQSVTFSGVDMYVTNAKGEAYCPAGNSDDCSVSIDISYPDGSTDTKDLGFIAPGSSDTFSYQPNKDVSGDVTYNLNDNSITDYDPFLDNEQFLRSGASSSNDVSLSVNGNNYNLGKFSDGETKSETIDLSTGSNTLDLSESWKYDYELDFQEITESIDPSVSVNGDIKSYDGKLADGETAGLPINETSIVDGENEISISVSESYDATGAVGLNYSHSGEISKNVVFNGSNWVESYNISKEWTADKENAQMRIPWSSSRVVSVSDVSASRNGNSLNAEYSSSGSELIVDLGDVNNGDTTTIEARGQKVDVVTGDIKVVDPTIEGEDLDTSIEVVSDAKEEPVEIDVSGTAWGDRVHYLESSDWIESDRARFDDSGNQVLVLPDAVAGSQANVETAPLKMSPENGDVVVTMESPDEPRFSLDPGNSSGDYVEIQYLDTVSGETYELVNVESDRVADRDTAESPAVFQVTDDSETFKITVGNLSATVGGPTGDDGGGFESSLLIAVAAAAILISALIGRRFGIGRRIVIPISVVVTIGVAELATPRGLISTLVGDSSRLVRDLLRGSAEPLVAIGLGGAFIVGLIVVDSRTDVEVPRSLYGLIGSAVLGWVTVSLGLLDGVGNQLITVVAAVGLIVSMVILQWETERDLPRPLIGGVGLIAGFWAIESVAPGFLTGPLSRGLGELSQLIWLAGIGIVLYGVYGWIQSRNEPDTQVTLSLGDQGGK